MTALFGVRSPELLYSNYEQTAVILFHLKNDTHGQAEEAGEVICINNFVNWYKTEYY
ncbi:hypothetical protein [Nostoc sp.]|uniref:hypothetical protein n=1 Tax=Nostoc sp. TaxID=1180 RepID=UPI002FF9F398